MFAYVLVRALCTARFSSIYLGANGHFFFFLFLDIYGKIKIWLLSQIYIHTKHTLDPRVSELWVKASLLRIEVYSTREANGGFEYTKPYVPHDFHWAWDTEER